MQHPTAYNGKQNQAQSKNIESRILGWFFKNVATHFLFPLIYHYLPPALLSKDQIFSLRPAKFDSTLVPSVLFLHLSVDVCVFYGSIQVGKSLFFFSIIVSSFD